MSEKVLLVDDEIDFLEVMSMRMKARDLEITTAESAEQAISFIKKKSFDAVIMDFQMPGMNGMEALKIIKNNNPEMQVILLTAYATIEKTVEVIKAGAMDLLEKPADIDALIDKIKKAKRDKELQIEKQTEERVKDILNRFGG
ncbi:MAG: response regulator [Deltaproteobacteria bacterium]|nr:response regulator [Deltaproteobacteria bacterium]